MRNKQTKIVATLSDKQCSVKLIKELYENGMDVVRLNTAHLSQEKSLLVMNNVRQVSDRIAIMLDTKGPEIRTTATDADIEIKTGQRIEIVHGNETTTGKRIFVSYEDIGKDVPLGATILIDDGLLGFKVLEKQEKHNALLCEAQNDGLLKSNKSVNVPGVNLKLPSITQKDIDFLHFAMKHDIDFIAHSFVRSKEDILAVQKILDEKKSHIKIIAKIENSQGVANISEIIERAYGIMIARGDLGNQLPVEEVPIVQKKIIKLCIEQAKPVIIATQMLQSMIDNPRPTRAEVSDVANAIYDGTDAVMLSGETAVGRYPAEAVKTMAKIAARVEKHKEDLNLKSGKKLSVREFLSKTAVEASFELPTKAIIIPTISGTSARIVSSYRGKGFIFARCFNRRVMRELALSYGVHPSYMEQPKSTDELVIKSLMELVEDKKLQENDSVIILAGTPGKNEGSNFIEINTVAKCLEDYRES